ncbi:MAG: linear amide C-N hydrolase [Elusimicrobiaceae bacterium]|nr:linear amide C-N hydrolase [Elusimicrobiaceae bacterium]
MKKLLTLAISTFMLLANTQAINACTGIAIDAADGTKVLARTIEWKGGNLNSKLIIMPRGHKNTALTPQGKNGHTWTNKYGAVGASTVEPEFVAEGVNEKGLNAGIFYFAGFGSLTPYNVKHAKKSVSDGELVRYILTNFASVEEALKGLEKIEIIPIGKPDKNGNYATGHWRISDNTGRSVVLEITDKGKRHIYENNLRVFTNSPSFPWHQVNLNNYIHITGGQTPAKTMGEVNLFSLGGGTNLLGLPGDLTPPARLVRAFFYTQTAPMPKDKYGAITQAFHILNNFDLPIGAEFAPGEQIPDMPSATQWTAVSDLSHPTFYYRTMYNSAIRRIDLTQIDFSTIPYQVLEMDEVPQETFHDRLL